MAPELRTPTVAAALLGGALLGFGPAFVPLVHKGVGSSSPTKRAPSAWGAAPQAAAGPGRVQQHGAGAAVAAAALLAAAALRTRREATRRPRAACTVVELAAPAAFAGAGLAPAVVQRDLVARKSLYSCYSLYFRKGAGIYKDRARRNIRNRAYNIFMKNKYKKRMKRVLRYTVELEFGDLAPASVQEVMSEIKERLDEACYTIDEVCVQGVIHQTTAARRKDRMCRALVRGCIAKGVLKKPEDPFEPAYKTLGYELPQCNHLREPRPWQLPGWKSPWMLKREYDKWYYQRRDKLKWREEKEKAKKAKQEAS